MFETQLAAGLGKEFGAIGRTPIGQHALDLDVVVALKGEGLAEGGQDARGALIGKQAGETEATMIVDGDVERLDAGAWVAEGAIAGGTDAGLREAAQFLDVEVEEFAGQSAQIQCVSSLDGHRAPPRTGQIWFGRGGCHREITRKICGLPLDLTAQTV